MQTNQSLYFDLYPFRDSAPTERLSIVRAEILAPISHTQGVAKLLTLLADSTPDLPPSVRALQQTLVVLTQHMYSLLEEATVPPTSDVHIAWERLLFLRANLQRPCEQLNVAIEQVAGFPNDVTVLFPQIEEWLESIRRASVHIWTTIDTLTHSDL